MENEKKGESSEEKLKKDTESFRVKYNNPARTYTRPYSAKTCKFYKDRDDYFAGIIIPISKQRYKTFDALLDELNRLIFMPLGVRHILRYDDNLPILSLDEIVQNGQYIASQSVKTVGVNVNKIAAHSATLRNPGGTKNQLMGIYFILNGKAKHYRATLNPMRPLTLTQLYDEISEKLEIAIHHFYTLSGTLITTIGEVFALNDAKLIACPRNERPHMEIKAILPQTTVRPSRHEPKQLVNNRNDTSRTSLPSLFSPTNTTTSKLSTTNGNGIEKGERNTRGTRQYATAKYITTNRFDLTTNNTNSTMIQKQEVKKRNPVEKWSRNTTQKYSYMTRKEQNGEGTTKGIGRTGRTGGGGGGGGSSNASTGKDSGTGRSIQSDNQDGGNGTERAQSTTERKAQMMREERLQMNGGGMDGEGHVSEEDRILEEDDDIDYDNDIKGHTHVINGSSDEEGEGEGNEDGGDEEDSAVGTNETNDIGTREMSVMSDRRSVSMSSRKNTAAVQTPSSAGSRNKSRQSGDLSRRSNRSERVNTAAVQTPSSAGSRSKSRQSVDTPYQQTPSRQTTAASSTHSHVDSQPASRLPSAASSVRSIGTGTSRRSIRSERVNTAAVHTPSTGRSRMSTRDSDREVILPSDDEEELMKIQNEAAAKIQNLFTNYKQRNPSLKNLLNEEGRISLSRVDSQDELVEIEEKEEIEGIEEGEEGGEYDIGYSIDVTIGRRFGTEFDGVLFVQIFGEEGESTVVNQEREGWLFETGKMNHVQLYYKGRSLGVLEKIRIGHDVEGYGGGTYIQDVQITEVLVGSVRRFLFSIDSWFDSGQVDGLIVRDIPLTCFMYIDPIEQEEKKRRSLNRWEFKLHTVDGEMGGTTSNITITGFSDNDDMALKVDNDKMLRDSSLVPLIQVDFGYLNNENIKKVRFEIDGQGDKPNYYLACVEALDLDRGDQCVIMVGKWLIKNPGGDFKKNSQSFREIPIYTLANLPMFVSNTFKGVVQLDDNSLCDGYEDDIQLQLCVDGYYGDYPMKSSTGLFPIQATRMTSGKMAHKFQFDAILPILTNYSIKIIAPLTNLGHAIMTGMGELNDIYTNMAMNGVIEQPMDVAENFLISEISLRSSDHAPFKTVFKNSSVLLEENNPQGPYFKHLTNSGNVGVSTQRKLTKEEKESMKESSDFVLQMSVLDTSTSIQPTVEIRNKKGMVFDMGKPIIINDRLFEYHLEGRKIGTVDKVRVSNENIEEEDDSKRYMNRMILWERNTKVQMQFLHESLIEPYETYEFQALYPDVGPQYTIYYLISVYTNDTNGQFLPYFNLYGENNDSGFRPFHHFDEFHVGQVVDRQVEVVMLRELIKIEMKATSDTDFHWSGSVVVSYLFPPPDQKSSVPTSRYTYRSEPLTISQTGVISSADLIFESRELEQLEPLQDNIYEDIEEDDDDYLGISTI